MAENKKQKSLKSARDKFLGFSLESSRKSYYPQLLEKLEEAKSNETRLQLLIDTLPARISYISTDERFILANRQYEIMFQKTRDEIIGKHLREVMGEANYATSSPYIKEVLDGREVNFAASYVGAEDKTYWNECTFIPIFNNDGAVDGFYVLAQDLTERKKAEEEKKRLEAKLYETDKFRAMGTLAGGVAHDFNNLLMGIQGHASLLEVKLDPSDPLIEHVKSINEQILSAASLTKQLLGLSRGGKYEVRPTDINKLLINNATMFGRTRKEISIQYKLEDRKQIVNVDRNQIEQVLLNLFINAWQAMPEGGELLLETKRVFLSKSDSAIYDLQSGAYVTIKVTDSGTGIPKEIQHRIFDPFFTTKEKQRGTGLGLASAYGIIKNHGGIINVYSEEGCGTTFSIYLPLSTDTDSDEIKKDHKLLQGTGNVLFVDDEEMILQVGGAMLKTLGYTVFAVNNGKAAIEHVANSTDTVDLIILDMIMPGMDGGTTFDRIRAINPDVPVILSSGYSLNGQAARIIDRGCDGFLQKPFNISELSKKIAEISAKRGGTAFKKEIK